MKVRVKFVYEIDTECGFKCKHYQDADRSADDYCGLFNCSLTSGKRCSQCIKKTRDAEEKLKVVSTIHGR